MRTVLVMVDGVRSAAQLLALTAGIGATQADLDVLLSQGLIAVKSDADASAAAPEQPVVTAFAAPKVAAPAATNAVLSLGPNAGAAMDDVDRFKLAYPLAVGLTSKLGLMGFGLNLAVESAGNLEQLRALSVKIEKAVGAPKFASLKSALFGN